MINISNLDEIKKLDSKNVFRSTELFISQCRQIHDLIEQQDLKSVDSNVNNVIFAGMGGSAYGGHIALSLFKDELPAAPYVNNDYGLPAFANSRSLIITTSYSGGTEETLSSFETAKSRSAHIIILTSGGRLGELSKQSSEAIIFDPTNNPSGQPRLGTGYIVLGTIEILRKIKLIKLQADDIQTAIAEVEKNIEHIKSSAMELSRKTYGNIPLIFSGSIFEGNAHILRNQFNETSKSFSSYHFLPEANHHVLEGLKNPQERKLIALFLDSNLYDPKIAKRVELTKDVILKNKSEVISYKAIGMSKLSQSLEFLAFGGYLTFYSAILYGQDPGLIPWVDYFKEKLAT